MSASSGPWATYATNKRAEAEGTRVDYPGGFWLVMRRAHPANARFTARHEALITKPHGRGLATGKLTDEDLWPQLAKVWAETIVTDWGSDEFGPGKVPGPDGKPLSFTVETLEKAFIEAPDFLRQVISDSKSLANFQTAQVEDDAKN